MREAWRFSNSTGLPLVPDNIPGANPRGLAIRFNLAEHVHTDIVSHSTDGFPTRNGDGFLEYLRAVAASDPAKPSPSPVENFLALFLPRSCRRTPASERKSFSTRSRAWAESNLQGILCWNCALPFIC